MRSGEINVCQPSPGGMHAHASSRPPEGSLRLKPRAHWHRPCHRWIPGRASFIGVGCTVQGVGAAQIWRMRESQIKPSHSLPVSRPLTSAAMLASSGDSHHVVLGDSQGGVEVWDLLEARPQPISVMGGTNLSAIHALDTCGGCSGEPGPPEVVSGAADGRVLVWDARQPERPVAQLCGGTSAAAWAVALGGAGTEQERSVLAGVGVGDLGSHWKARCPLSCGQ